MSRPVTVPVSEVFGPTIQGEGALVGTRTLFVRVGGCDYRCAWCDTPYAVLPEHRKSWTPMTPEAIGAACLALAAPTDCAWVTLSGGNPALFNGNEAVVRELQRLGYKVSIETQGSINAAWLPMLDHVCLSPKPPSSQMTPDDDDFAAILRALAVPMLLGKVSVKLVAFDEADLAWANAFVQRHAVGSSMLFLSAGTTQGLAPEATFDAVLDRTRWLVEAARSYPFLSAARVLPQLHVLLWGTARGK